MVRKVSRSSRQERDPGTSRQDRQMSDREVIEDRELTEEERLDMFRTSFFNSALPNLPRISGFHVCWLTTTNPRDPIHARLRLGYQLIKAEDVPGWEHSSLKTGDWIGCIGVNEMLAAKLPIDLYEAYMREVHYEQPLQEEEKLNAATEDVLMKTQSMAKSRRIALMKEEGSEELGKDAPRVPSFAVEAGDVDPPR